MKEKKNARQVPLYQWIWSSYLKTALIPLVVVELVFIGIYFAANNWSRMETIAFLQSAVKDELSQIAVRETNIIFKQLDGISNATDLLAKRVDYALKSDAAASEADRSRLAMSPDGVYYTTKDSPEGGAAVFFSGYMPIGDQEKRRAEKVLSEQQLMKDLQQSQPLVVSLYFNSFDSLNVIYPYFDVLDQYVTHMNIPSYNFYYEADAEHNPERVVKWTDVYLDPAGHGWMASAIAPVYDGDFLEGVVGLDITVDTFTQQILNMKLPWTGYGMLVGKDGTILALPPAGESEWGLDELTTHEYSEAIKQDTFKPEQFNLYKREDMKEIGAMLTASDTGYSEFTLNGSTKASSWSTVPNTGWKLLLLIDKESVFSETNAMTVRLLNIGVLMVVGLFLFYSIFFYVLSRRARLMSQDISRPLRDLNEMVQNIGDGHYYQQEPDISVRELQETGSQLVLMGNRLGNLNSALMLTKEEAEKASQAKSRFLSSMSHELRTPLNAILGFAQVMEMNQTQPLSEEHRECLKEIRQAGSHLLTLINEVLDFSGIESGSPKLMVEPVHFGAIIDESLSMITQMARSAGVRLVREASCDKYYLMADRVRLKQIVINLLSNAIKYNRQDGEVRISCSAEDGYVSMHVADTGIGIEKDDLESIFTPFHRVASVQHVEGTGIGLTVTKQLVELMNGRIIVVSKPNEGSCFTLTFVSADAPAGHGQKPSRLRAVEAATQEQVSVPEPQACRVLYIEDNQANTNLMIRIMKKYPQVTLLTAATGEEGVLLAKTALPDLILLDLGLPDINGFEVQQRLAADTGTAGIPVLAVSANVLQSDIDKAAQLGFAGYMTKPIGISRLLEELIRLLGGKESDRNG